MDALYPLETESDALLLVRLTEEAAEVQKLCCKAQRFGLRSYHPADPEKTPNADLIGREITDFARVATEMRKRGLLP